MRLNRQLWIAVVIVMVLAFGLSFLVSTESARRYFAEQLFVKNVDNATALALSISQMEKDPVTIELLISAQFDAGHYREISLLDPNGSAMVARKNESKVDGVPEAFQSLVSLKVKPGIAQVMDGWNQYGSVMVVSHDQYAYQGLWQSVIRLLIGFAAASLAVGLVGSGLLRSILRPLKNVVAQAQAIGERRFITQTEPKTFEFRQLVHSMNALSERVKKMLEEESRRVELLRQQAQIDPITGLRNRETFIATLEDALQRDDISASGVLVIVRIAGLAELNLTIGRKAVDQLLRRVGERLARAANGQSSQWVVARLGAVDFAIMAPGESDGSATAANLLSQAQLAVEQKEGLDRPVMRAGSTPYLRSEDRGAVLARADGALALAEETGSLVSAAGFPPADVELPSDQLAWRETLETAMRNHGVELGQFPVVSSSDGSLLHLESPVRLNIGGQWLPAARFIAWAARLHMVSQIDTMAVEAALKKISENGQSASVSISPESVSDPSFAAFILRRLRREPELASKLWLEVSEYGALRQLPEFRQFCLTITPLNCKLGLKHAGQHFSRIAELHDLGLDYLKIDGSIVQIVRDGPEHQNFLRSLCAVAHSIGLVTIAAGIPAGADLPLLTGLGIDGFTGPGVAAPEQ